MVGASIILSFCVGRFYSNNDRIIRLVLWKSSAANEDSGDAYVDTDETNQNDHICNVAADRRVGLSCMEPSLSSARSVQNVRLVCMLCICIPFMGDINLQPRHAEEYADLALFGSRCDAVRSHDAISAGHLLV